MSDFNKFDPNLGKGINFSHQKQGKKEAPADAEGTEQGAKSDPYADQKIDPAKVMAFLSLQGKQTGQIDYMPVVHSVQAFTELFSPERHEELLNTFLDIIREDAPGLSEDAQANLAQDALDNYLIGTPVVQGA